MLLNKNGLAAAILSALLMILASPPFGYSFLAWFALVPLLVSIRSQDKNRLRVVWIFSLLWLGTDNLWYFWGFPIITALWQWIGMIALPPLLFRVSQALETALPRRRAIILPAIWTSFYFILSRLPVTKFWWTTNIHNTQWREPFTLQMLSITGVYGLLFCLLAVNGLLAEIILAYRAKKSPPRALLGATLILLVVIYGYGYTRLQATRAAPHRPVIIASLQSNAPSDAPQAALSRLINQAKSAKKTNPETRYILGDETLSIILTPSTTATLASLATDLDTYLVVNMLEPKNKFNTAVLFAPEGREILRYYKWYPTALEQQRGIAVAPQKLSVAKTEDDHVGLAICYDQNFEVIKANVAAGANLVFAPVDDSRFGPWVFPQLHAAETVFRAVEHGVAITTAATTGLSQIVSPFGEIRKASQRTYDEEIIFGQTYTIASPTWYTRHGDVFGYAIVGTAFGLIILAVFVRYGKLRQARQ